MLIYQNVAKRFYDHDVLSDVHLHIKRGDFVVITGESGAGKTMLINLMIGAEKPTRGKIFLDGQDLHQLSFPSLQILRRNIGVVFENCQLLDTKTVFENVAFALHVAERPKDTISNLVNKTLERTGMSHRKDAFPYQLSGGEKRRVSFARAMVNDPVVLIADEPTNGLNDHHATDIIGFLNEAHKAGTTVIVTTHNHHALDGFSQDKKRIFELKNGKIYERLEHVHVI